MTYARIIHALDTASRRPRTSITADGQHDIDLSGHIQSHAYDRLSRIHYRHTGRSFRFKDRIHDFEFSYASEAEYEEIVSEIEMVSNDPYTFQTPPPPSYTLKDIEILMGDGGRCDSGEFDGTAIHDKRQGDCVARALAFGLNRGMPDKGLAYLYAHRLISKYDTVYGDADWGQYIENYIDAYKQAGFEYDELEGRVSVRSVQEFRVDRERGMVVAWTGHTFAIRADGVVMDAFPSVITPRRRPKVKSLCALFHETRKADSIRASLGVIHGRLYGEPCPAYAEYMGDEDFTAAGLSTPRECSDKVTSGLGHDEVWRRTFAAL